MATPTEHTLVELRLPAEMRLTARRIDAYEIAIHAIDSDGAACVVLDPDGVRKLICALTSIEESVRLALHRLDEMPRGALRDQLLAGIAAHLRSNSTALSGGVL